MHVHAVAAPPPRMQAAKPTCVHVHAGNSTTQLWPWISLVGLSHWSPVECTYFKGFVDDATVERYKAETLTTFGTRASKLSSDDPECLVSPANT